MTTIRLDSSDGDDVRDGAFFRLTARLFSPAFCAGAGVLLGSYDDAQVPAVRATPAPHQDVTVLPAALAVPRRRGA